MKNELIVALVAALSVIMVGASLFWVASTGGIPAWVSLLVALLSFFFNLSGAAYLAEGEKLEKNVSMLKEYGGKVAIAIPVCNPELEGLKKCIQSAMGIEYFDDFGVFVLDDTKEGNHPGKVEKIGGRLGAG